MQILSDLSASLTGTGKWGIMDLSSQRRDWEAQEL
jgi:hypothetical protein